jgi:hypothetical protein
MCVLSVHIDYHQVLITKHVVLKRDEKVGVIWNNIHIYIYTHTHTHTQLIEHNRVDAIKLLMSVVFRKQFLSCIRFCSNMKYFVQ